MWFKNLQLYRLALPVNLTAESLHQALAKLAFSPSTSMDLQNQGWASPRDNDLLVHTVNGQMLIMLGTEKKLLPASVINQVCKAKATELEEQQGFKPGRKQMKDLKEQVTDELLPRAFSIRRNTWAWIDPLNGWLVVDAASPARADELLKPLLKVVNDVTLYSLRVAQLPASAMTSWLAADEAPAGFSIDQDTELRSAGEDKAAVRYVSHTIDPDDVRRHIAAGKQCTRLAMTWADRISFVLTESLAIKRVTALDVIKENSDSKMQNDEERFDSDFALMTGELNHMLGDLVAALGGEAPQQP
ncbi:recombination-associated protein RdgC [Herminiimonas sp. CN]|uniref:recombination-associated protein RdgC n=1 Tax=Herminiimonas sp. CN TaxID=1349818 RepID=UPI00047442AC|nr:recombination-associated protein RdgC [Herminiimonas sp. CN]